MRTSGTSVGVQPGGLLRRPFWVLFCLLAFWSMATGARSQGIESIVSPGKLVQSHAKVDDECKQCHTKFDRKAQDGLCMACHKDVGADVRGKAGLHGKMKQQACRTCHTDHKGRAAQIADFDKTKFDHTPTDFTCVPNTRSWNVPSAIHREKNIGIRLWSAMVVTARTMCTRVHWVPSAPIATTKTCGKRPNLTMTPPALR